MLEGALDRVSMGIAFARKSGEVMYANECARRFLDTYSLAARPPVSMDQKWHYLLRGSLSRIVRDMDSAGQIWTTPNGRLLIEIQPLRAEADGSSILGRRGGAMLMMQERGKHQFPALEQLMDLFGLTHAEARTCLTLCQVESAKKCANQLNVSLATVRSQLQAAMQKTSTSKQAELLSIVLSIPMRRTE